MRTDAFLLLSDAQAVTVDAASTNALALGAAGVDVGVGEPLAVVFVIDVAADHTTGDETYKFAVRTATASDGTTGAVSIVETPAIAGSALTAGTRFALLLPQNRIASTATHLAAYYDVTGTTPTVTVTAFVQPASMVQNDKYFASGFEVGA